MSALTPDRVAHAARLAADARHVCVFSGAGMSAESGIPTFRDALTGLWENYDPADLASPAGWRRDPDLVWGWYRERAAALRAVAPNDGHAAIAALGRRKERDGGRVSIVTQNVDDLHERAGSVVDAHLHGSLLGPRCEACAFRGDPELSLAIDRPRCPQCAASLRPDVVWFGEVLPESAWDTAVAAASACDLMIIIGTSGVVHPAASLPTIAADSGASIIEVNPEPSALTPLATVYLESTAAAALPAIS
ncbi:NAD-dependent deacylase [Gordonia hydrophobica]|uniref:NAD-dependent protein deacylase n=1 Tax=Gordonia hydrophobica TaxID=40516 RepID=A0ABZ2U1A3_9ACTN|nr:NAD-dependent deacylase [Gordonia hydrophobica]MBM7368565.1 NAD-dependent deacetylase [Gordonia hydrophobica]